MEEDGCGGGKEEEEEEHEQQEGDPQIPTYPESFSDGPGAQKRPSEAENCQQPPVGEERGRRRTRERSRGLPWG